MAVNKSVDRICSLYMGNSFCGTTCLVGLGVSAASPGGDTEYEFAFRNLWFLAYNWVVVILLVASAFVALALVQDKDEKKIARVTEAFLKMKKFDIAELKKAY
jgi:NO-binding membrane sensor protein with MHYT domain